MFGYVLPYKTNMRQQDYILYRAFYCGMCKTVGDVFGQLPRYSVTYDAALMCALVSDCLDYPEEIREMSCVGAPFKKKPMIVRNELMEKLAAVNIILCRHKLHDDFVDGGGKSRLALKLISKAYNKAKSMQPEADKIVADSYESLRKCELAGEKSVDKVSHCFASMMRDLFACLLGDKAGDAVLSLAYNIGKFVYIADALDDIDEDVKSGNYNPLLSAFGNYVSRRQFIDDNRDELDFMFASTVNRAISSFNRMIFTQSRSLIENIVYYGLRDKTEQLFASDKKLDRPRI